MLLIHYGCACILENKLQNIIGILQLFLTENLSLQLLDKSTFTDYSFKMNNYLALYSKNKPLQNTFRRQRQHEMAFWAVLVPLTANRQFIEAPQPRHTKKGLLHFMWDRKRGTCSYTPHSTPQPTEHFSSHYPSIKS